MAGIRKPIITALNTSTYVGIVVPGTSSIAAYTEDLTAFYVAKDSAGTDEALIPANTSPSWEKVFPDDDGYAFYAKAVSGTPNLVLLSSQKG